MLVLVLVVSEHRSVSSGCAELEFSTVDYTTLLYLESLPLDKKCVYKKKKVVTTLYGWYKKVCVEWQ